MLAFSRLISKHSYIRRIALISSQSHISSYKTHPPIPNPNSPFPSSPFSRHFSSNWDNNGNRSGGGGGGGSSSGFEMWKFSSEDDNQGTDSIFGEETPKVEGFKDDSNVVVANSAEEESWTNASGNEEGEGAIFDVGSDAVGGGGVDLDWQSGDGEDADQVFEFETESTAGAFSSPVIDEEEEARRKEEEKRLEIEEKALNEVLKGSNRTFGDLIASSGITEEMLDSLMALKDLDDIPGLPPLSEIEKMRYEKNTKKSSRADIERQKQEEIAKSRVRQVDNKGRAYGTGKRKCSIARVWIQPGDGKFIINDKQFDVYFPMLDHRAALLRPFSETKTLGLMDVNCTVKGGGTTGQVGAIRLGISRALQNWAPEELRPPLKEAGFLTRDSRVVERKKPGKAKARKSFQWVKR